MMLQKITVNCTPGTNTISVPQLAFTTVIAVHRTGTQLHLALDRPAGSLEIFFVPANGTFIVDPGYPFLPSETLFIIFREGTDGEVIVTPPVLPPAPTVCNPAPGMSVVINANKSVTVTWAEIGTYNIAITPSANICASGYVQMALITAGSTWTSAPLAVGMWKVCLQRRCSDILFSEWSPSTIFEIAADPPPPNNFGARKVPTNTNIQIVSITGFDYTPTVGAYPLDFPSETIAGRHEGFTNKRIRVAVQLPSGGRVVVALYKNGPLVQYLVAYRTIAGVVIPEFDPITAFPTDNIYVNLDYS